MKRPMKAEAFATPPGGWNSEIYVLDETGTPKVNRDGLPMKRRGRRKGSHAAPAPAAGRPSDGDPLAAAVADAQRTQDYLPDGANHPDAPPVWIGPGSITPGGQDTGPATGANGTTDGAPGTPAVADSPSAPIANIAVSSFIGLGCMVLGDGFAPASDAERDMLVSPTAAYLDSLEITDIPPGIALVGVVFAYTAGKMADPTVRAAAVKRWQQLFPARQPAPKPSPVNMSQARPAADATPPTPAPEVRPVGDQLGQVQKGPRADVSTFLKFEP